MLEHSLTLQLLLLLRTCACAVGVFICQAMPCCLTACESPHSYRLYSLGLTSEDCMTSSLQRVSPQSSVATWGHMTARHGQTQWPNGIGSPCPPPPSEVLITVQSHFAALLVALSRLTLWLMWTPFTVKCWTIVGLRAPSEKAVRAAKSIFMIVRVTPVGQKGKRITSL